MIITLTYMYGNKIISHTKKKLGHDFIVIPYIYMTFSFFDCIRII